MREKKKKKTRFPAKQIACRSVHNRQQSRGKASVWDLSRKSLLLLLQAEEEEVGRKVIVSMCNKTGIHSVVVLCRRRLQRRPLILRPLLPEKTQPVCNLLLARSLCSHIHSEDPMTSNDFALFFA